MNAQLAVDLGASGIDLNFGCPAKTVNRHDGGASLLRHPHRLEGIVRAVRAMVPPDVPVSAKIRTGWDDHRAVRTLARAAEAGGASWLTVHGRTRAEGYGPAANWQAIGEAVSDGKFRTLAVPRWLLDITACTNLLFASLLGYQPMLTPGKARELVQPDWLCDNSEFTHATGWKPRLDLKQGAQQLFNA